MEILFIVTVGLIIFGVGLGLIVESNPCTLCSDRDTIACDTCKNHYKRTSAIKSHYTPIENNDYIITREFLNSEKFNSFSDKDKERVLKYWNEKVAPQFRELCRGVDSKDVRG